MFFKRKNRKKETLVEGEKQMALGQLGISLPRVPVFPIPLFGSTCGNLFETKIAVSCVSSKIKASQEGFMYPKRALAQKTYFLL